jgi:prevent-host-death family protein
LFVDRIAQRDLRNDISDILRRVERGEQFEITVGGRPVAQIVPLDRRQFVSRDALEEIFALPEPEGLWDDICSWSVDLTDPFA